MSVDDPIVTVEHVRQAKLCVRGAKQWFALHGLDFAHFLAHGYPCSVIAACNDALGDRVIALARADAAGDAP